MSDATWDYLPDETGTLYSPDEGMWTGAEGVDGSAFDPSHIDLDTAALTEDTAFTLPCGYEQDVQYEVVPHADSAPVPAEHGGTASTHTGSEPATDDVPPAPAHDPGAPGSGDVVHGDPVDQAPYWWAQSYTNDCAPSSVGDIVNQFTGQHLTEADVVDAANSMGLLGPDGMTLQDAHDLLAHYGISSSVASGSMDDLRQMLDQGRDVTLAVDSHELWTGSEPDAQNDHADHAVLITGIDDTKGVVYLNDSGTPDGRMEEVPISVLEQAWADSGHQMVVTDSFSPVVHEGGQTIPLATPGPVLLPVTLSPQPQQPA